MAISLVGCSSNVHAGTAGSPLTFSMPGTVAAGDLLVVMTCSDGISPDVLAAPTGFTQMENNGSTPMNWNGWFKRADGTEGSSISITHNTSSSNEIGGTLMQFRGTSGTLMEADGGTTGTWSVYTEYHRKLAEGAWNVVWAGTRDGQTLSLTSTGGWTTDHTHSSGSQVKMIVGHNPLDSGTFDLDDTSRCTVYSDPASGYGAIQSFVICPDDKVGMGFDITRGVFNTDSITVTKPANLPDNSLLFCAFSTGGSYLDETISLTGWTSLYTPVNHSTDALRIQLLYKVVGSASGEGANYTFSSTRSVPGVYIMGYCTYVNQSDPIDTYTNTENNTSGFKTFNLTPGADECGMLQIAHGYYPSTSNRHVIGGDFPWKGYYAHYLYPNLDLHGEADTSGSSYCSVSVRFEQGGAAATGSRTFQLYGPLDAIISCVSVNQWFPPKPEIMQTSGVYVC